VGTSLKVTFPHTILIHVRFSRDKTEVTVRGFGFTNSMFLHFALSTSDDISRLLITYSNKLQLANDFEMRVTAFERVSLML
jgi:hypothetical protein